ncbi:PIN domain-containing protein [Bacteroidales bacterium OttesenSCG-928-K22]|nr:PIN domain-containing protein [Bacteroidales bacterium OttesenSCG-928-L14]MDL2240191.1 PIN domain-containing protein [Bacteroidales bacterium OttesenSCG-928-K22]
MKYIFLDANIFIHFQPYDQICWKDITKDEYRIIIAPITLDELDKHKINPNKKIAKRVKAILPKIENEQNKTDKILEVYMSIPKDETFNRYNLTRIQSDHSLLASVIEFGEVYGLENIILISYDTGPRIRARQIGINVFELDRRFLLKEEDSDEEKELKRLRKENVELKNNLPNVILSFQNGKIYENFEITPIAQTENEYCNVLLDEVKNQHKPFIKERNIDYDNLNDITNFEKNLPIIQNSFFSVTGEQKRNYNKKLNDFYIEYEKIFRERFKYDTILSYAVRLNLKVSNNGTAPANDIDIFLSFPDDTNVLFYNNFPKLKKPKPPFKPQNSYDYDRSHLALPYNRFNLPPEEYIHIIDESYMENTIKHFSLNNEGTAVNFKFQKSLKHNLQFSLEPIWVVAKNNFKIEYKLLIANFPQAITGELNVQIKNS